MNIITTLICHRSIPFQNENSIQQLFGYAMKLEIVTQMFMKPAKCFEYVVCRLYSVGFKNLLFSRFIFAFTWKQKYCYVNQRNPLSYRCTVLVLTSTFEDVSSFAGTLLLLMMPSFLEFALLVCKHHRK